MKKGRSKMLKSVLNRHRDKLHKIAEKNTVRNENGFTVASKNDPWREDETDSDETFRQSYRKQGMLV